MGLHQDRKEATRVRLLGIAAEQFKSRGYEAVTLREVAKAAGCSTGTIFGSFAGKDELFEAATGRRPPPERIREWLRLDGAGSAVLGRPQRARQLLADLYGTDSL